VNCSENPRVIEEQPTRFWQKISLIADISSLCRQSRHRTDTFAEVLRLIQNIIPFDAASLYLYDGRDDGLVMHACVGDAVPLPKFITGSERSPAAKNNRIAKPILRRNATDRGDFDQNCEFAVTLSAPLLVDAETIGFLILGAYAAVSLQEKHIKLMSIVADQLAVSIERINYVEKLEDRAIALQKAHHELQAAQEQIIAAEKLEIVGQLATSINHKINNPLSVIVGHVQILMLNRENLPAEVSGRLDRIEEAALRIGEVNRRLLGIDSIISDGCLDDLSRKMINLEKSNSESSSAGVERNV